MNKFHSLMMLAMCLIAFSACNKDNDDINSNSKVFSVEVFKTSLKTQLNGAKGYAFVINQGGSFADSASFGIGYQNVSNGMNGPASVKFDINIASVTKTLTAMAAIKLLEEKGISIDGAIGNWLPGYWTKNTDMSNITFKELLTHTSGIRQSNTSWDSLKATIAGPLEGTKTYSYANVNFALFRAMLPKINDVTTFDANENNSASFETWMSLQYINVIQEQVLEPIGIYNAICDVTPGTTTMQGYNEIGVPLIAQSAGDWTEFCGGGGFYLTTVEMARVLAFLTHSNDILSNSQLNLMDDNLLGWDPGDSFNTSHGQAYGKDGALYWDNNGNGQVNGGDSGLQTWVGKFSNGVELALSVTSIASSYRNFPTLVKNAYEAAWVEP